VHGVFERAEAEQFSAFDRSRWPIPAFVEILGAETELNEARRETARALERQQTPVEFGDGAGEGTDDSVVDRRRGDTLSGRSRECRQRRRATARAWLGYPARDIERQAADSTA
jgi:hypothetical protein